MTMSKGTEGTSGVRHTGTDHDRGAIIQARLVKRWPSTVRYTRPGTTRLCIDGFPRSANSLLVRKFLLANRPEYKGLNVVSHHTHDPDSVQAAVLASIPVIMPVRAPADCIPSLMIYSPAIQAPNACKRYLDMVSLAVQSPRAILPAPFDLIVGNVNSIFAAANARFGLTLKPIPMDDDEASRIIAEQVEAAGRATHGEQWQRKVGVPASGRALDKSVILESLHGEPAFAACQATYHELLSLMDRHPS